MGVMRHFKKRTVALCLASVITVLGAFGDDAFSNNLVDLQVTKGSGGRVELTAYTEKPYEQSIMTERIGDNMYNITFPGAKSSIKRMPDLSNCENIESIQVSTFPTTTGQEGFTRIFIKTINEPRLSTRTTLFLHYNDGGAINSISTTPAVKKVQPAAPPPKKETSYWDAMNSSPAAKTNASQTQPAATSVPKKPKTEKTYQEENKEEKSDQISEDFPVNYNDIPTESGNERWLMIIGIAVVLLLVAFIYFLGKDKMASVVGEQNKIDLNDDEKDKKKKRTTKKIRKTINNLDQKYRNNPSAERINIVTGAIIEPEEVKPPEEVQKKEEEVPEPVVVDLDTLFNEKTKGAAEQDTPENTEEHDDLAEFLNDFSFEEEIAASEAEEPTFDEELYEKTINEGDVHFSKEDKDRIAVLMRNEISDETMDNISEFAPSEPLEPKVPPEVTKLENLLAEYTIKQDLSFSKDDVDTIKRLMNVEMDESFINDLRTNSERTEQMRQELENKEKKPHKASEIITLNVKDLLPDLSKELKKQGNKRIESEAKPDVVYFSEGYEVSKLSVSNDLADISGALKKQKKDDFRPSDNLPIVENGYEVQTLSIKDELPDLADVRANPKKYEDKKPKEKIDEDALLRSISNVKFKPFYENVQNELNQFEGFEVINSGESEPDIKEDDTEPIFENDIGRGTVIDLDEENKGAKGTDDDAQKLIKIIEAQQLERQKKETQLAEKTHQAAKTDENKPAVKQINAVCKVNDKQYHIIKTIPCSQNFSCCLAHDNDGYDILGRLNGGYQLLKHYDSLNTENIQSRVNEKNVDGSVQYLIRVSIHKFVVNVTQNSMEFVMDLC